MYQKAVICFFIVIPVFCLAVYLNGFFPLKTSIPGHAELRNFTLSGKILSTPPTLFDKLVIVLIDALRADFILNGQNNSMSHVSEMIRDGRGIVFDVKAHPPTVTLPRIKAITTGTIPGFIDVVLNFDSSSLEEDNLVSQMKRAGKQLVFYGDDTWLKLFPDHFVRSDGTTSFFVSDYTEVDNNVTRHLDSELSFPDWDMMILHYLGLDHIGHLEGPYSPLVAPKLQEMDDVISRIYTALEKQSPRSLILVCGDHGMSDHGGHGGASDKETLVPALFISPQFKNKGHLISSRHHRSPLQIDLAPTLSVLMGLPIPNNNLGQVLQGVLEAGGLGAEAILDVLYINSQQIVQLMEANVPSYKSERSFQMFLDTVNLHKEFLVQPEPAKSDADMRQILYLYETTLEALSDRISSSLTDYDMYQLVIAPVSMLMAFITVLLMVMRTGSFFSLQLSLDFSLILPASGYILWHLMACSSTSFHSKTMCSFNMVSALVHSGMIVILTGVFACLKARLNMKTSTKCEWFPNTMVTKFLLAGSILHSVTYVSSSNIEEEHQTCYFLVTTFFCLNSVQSMLIFSQNYYIQKIKLATKSFKKLTSFLHETVRHEKTQTCACGEMTCEETKTQQNCGICENDSDAIRKRFNEILKDESDTGFADDEDSDSETEQNSSARNNEIKGNAVPKVDFPTGELLSSLTVLMIVRFLRSLNQTGNKWLDRPDVGDWLNKPENKLVLTIAVLVSLLVLWFIVARKWGKYSFGEMMVVGLPLISCYRYRAKTGVIEDFLNHISKVDKKYIGTIQFMIVYGIGFVLIFRNLCNWVVIKVCKITDVKIKTQTAISIIESVQHALLLMMAILLRTHNILYVVGLGFIEMLIESLVPSIISLPIPYLAMVCLWLGRASFFYQGNSNSLSSIDVAAGYAGIPHYQATIVSIQLFLTTYSGPIFWFIVLIKYIYIRKLRCDTETDSLSARLRKGVSQTIITLVLERLFTLLLYTTVTTSERYHLFVWTVFSPKLLYEGMFTLLSAMVQLIYLCLL